MQKVMSKRMYRRIGFIRRNLATVSLFTIFMCGLVFIDHHDLATANQKGLSVLARMGGQPEDCCKSPPAKPNKVIIDRNLYSYLSGRLRDAPFGGVDHYRQYTIVRSNLKPLPGVKPLRPDFGPPLNDVTSFRYPLTVKSCRQGRKAPRTLFVAVMSAAAYFHKRDVIRQTWASRFPEFSHLVDVIGFSFVVGRTLNATVQKGLEDESSVHGDIIQVDMIDAYANMTLKVAGLLNWLTTHCSHADFVMKVDDDVYINIHNLANSLQKLSPAELTIHGSEIYDKTVQRGREEKWTISHEEWPWKDYPTFLRGGCILMSGRAIPLLLAAVQVTPFIPFDDVYLSGLSASKAGVQGFHTDGMFDAEPPLPPDGCFVRITISWLTASDKQMFESHEAVNKFYNNSDPCMIVRMKQPRHDLKPEEVSIHLANSVRVDPAQIIEFTFQRL